MRICPWSSLITNDRDDSDDGTFSMLILLWQLRFSFLFLFSFSLMTIEMIIRHRMDRTESQRTEIESERG